jgi:predicted AlkP superfamily phosphohydrolase/phosphomutase
MRNAGRCSAATLLLAAAALAACARGPEARGRVLVVGIDGASLRVIGPLLEQGRLANLAALARAGASGPLRASPPLLSPRIWNSIATGKRPEKHGILDFARPADGGGLQLYLGTDRAAHALWNVASDAGLDVGVVNWWNTFPPDRVRGVIVSDHLFAREVEERRFHTKAAPAPAGPLVHPEAWDSRLAALARETPPPGLEDPFRERSGLPEWIATDSLESYFRQDAAVTRLALAIEAETRPDLLMVLLTGIDRVSHGLWIGVETNEPYPERLHLSAAERAAVRGMLEHYYDFTDRLVGNLVDRYDANDLVLVVSDHGFEAGVSLEILTGIHESEHAAEGVIFARGAGIPAGSRAGPVHVLDVTPTVLAWWGLPVGEDMDGTVRFLPLRGVRTIPTHDVAPVARAPLGASGVEETVLQQLRELGYVE